MQNELPKPAKTTERNEAQTVPSITQTSPPRPAKTTYRSSAPPPLNPTSPSLKVSSLLNPKSPSPNHPPPSPAYPPPKQPKTTTGAETASPKQPKINTATLPTPSETSPSTSKTSPTTPKTPKTPRPEPIPPTHLNHVNLSISLPFRQSDYRILLIDTTKTLRLACNTLTDNFTFSNALADHFPGAKQINLHISLRKFLSEEEERGVVEGDLRECLEMLLKVRDKYTFGFRVFVDEEGVGVGVGVGRNPFSFRGGVEEEEGEVVGRKNRGNLSAGSKFRVVAWFFELAERDWPGLGVDLRY